MTGRYIIDRQVHLQATPMRVAAELARSPWRAAMTIEPVGAGSRVRISGSVEPEGLAAAVEAAALGEVCDLRTRLESAQPTNNRETNGRKSNSRETNRKAGTKRPTVQRRSTTMTTISRRVTIDATPEQVWPALADFGGIATWNPNVKASRLTSTQGEGTGTSRECQLTPMGTVQERIIDWNEGEMMSVEIYEFKNVPAMRSAIATFHLVPNGQGTDVSMDMDYQVGLGALGAGMNSVMMKRQFSRAVTGLLAGLKYHVETGRPVESGATLPTDTVVAA